MAGVTGEAVDSAVRPVSTGARCGLCRIPPPVKLQVEPSARCNVRCRMCMLPYRADVRPREPGLLSWTLYCRLLDQLPGLQELHLQGLGEPFLHPRFPDMVARGAERGARVTTNTNATLLTEDLVAEVVAAGLAELHVSVDAASPDAYEDIRVGGRWERLVAGLEAVRTVRERRAASPGSGPPRRRRSAAMQSAGPPAGKPLGPATPAGGPGMRLVFVAVLMRRNLAELPGLVRLAARFGADELFVQRLIQDFSEAPAGSGYAQMRRFVDAELLRVQDLPRAEALYTEARGIAAERGLALRLPSLGDLEPRRRLGTALDPPPGSRRTLAPPPAVPLPPAAVSRCRWPWEGVYVTHAGEILPCCTVADPGRYSLGNAAEHDLAQVWQSAGYRSLRRRLAGGRPSALCAACAVYRGSF